MSISTPISGMSVDEAKWSYVMAIVQHRSRLNNLSESIIRGMTLDQVKNEYRNIVTQENNLVQLRDHIIALQGGSVL